jgi:hypothetical protein
LDTKAKMDKFGVPYEEEPGETTSFWDKELTPETEHSMSPYPSNVGIYDHSNGGEIRRPGRNLRKRKEVVKDPPPLPPRLPRLMAREQGTVDQAERNQWNRHQGRNRA